MNFYPKKTIVSHLTPNQILYLLENSVQFTGNIENTKFTIRERKFFSNKVLFPVITGIVDVQKDNTIIDVAFEISRRDKVGLGIFILSTFLLSLLLGFVSSDIILAMTLICFELACCAVFLMFYKINCRRAFKKILRLIESVN